MSEEDRRMGLGTSQQPMIPVTPAEPSTVTEAMSDCLDIGLPSDQSEINGGTTSTKSTNDPEETIRLDETPIKLSTQKTIRINRKNFRSPAVSMIPTGSNRSLRGGIVSGT